MSEATGSPRASLDLLRRITDRHVVDRLVEAGPSTRADIATATGISKPTVSESVRRLERDGVVTQQGRSATGRRGPAGVSYGFAADLGVALALDGGPDGLVAEVLDLRGEVLRRVSRAAPAPVTAAVLAPLLLELVQDACADAPGPVRSCAVSLAGPVDRASGRLVHLPSSPFLVDELDARALLEPVLGVEVAVDNDVNWAALAERDAGVAVGLEDFCYLHLGYGFGGAVVQDGRLVRGHAGLAGEPAHMVTTGPDGRAMSLVECFGLLGLRRPASDTIDVVAVREALTSSTRADRDRRDAVLEAVVGVLRSTVALLNPAVVVVGGPWASTDGFVERLAARASAVLVPPTAVVPASLGPGAPLLGARRAAVTRWRKRLLDPVG